MLTTAQFVHLEWNWSFLLEIILIVSDSYSHLPPSSVIIDPFDPPISSSPAPTDPVPSLPEPPSSTPLTPPAAQQTPV